ncbi:MAG: hypothetical protein QJR08_05705 [Bacillota bacterium]|nr:hypothetical protein [Bacillota bacterium]
MGKVGPRHYYCWDCCAEFNWRGGKLDVFLLDAEGEKRPLKLSALRIRPRPQPAL